jgi:predicted Zn-dependent protease
MALALALAWRHWYEFSHPSVDRRIARLEVLARQLARPRERAREDWIVSAR